MILTSWLDHILDARGFIKSANNPCLFPHMLVLCTDDWILISKDGLIITNLIQDIKKNITLETLGMPKIFLASVLKKLAAMPSTLDSGSHAVHPD
jgi:hypothetical protein